MAKLEALARQRRAVLRLSIHESASEVNRSGGDAQVVSYHRYLVVFHPFVEQLITVFHTSGLASSASVYYTERKLKNKKRARGLGTRLHLDSFGRCSESSTSISMPSRDGILSGTCQKIRIKR